MIRLLVCVTVTCLAVRVGYCSIGTRTVCRKECNVVLDIARTLCDDTGYSLHPLTLEEASDCNCEKGCVGNPSGKCSKCKVGWYGPYCQKKNVALNGTATQQGTFQEGRAALAVDGNTNTDFNQGSCSHADSRNNSWWSVQLGKNGVNQIRYMRIFNRNNVYQYEGRRVEMEILLNGKRCKKWPVFEIPEIIENVTCNETLTGHNLTITVQEHHLSLCEVQVFVCSDGWFGEDCEKQCNCLYSNETCDKVTGRCRLGCGAGYMGYDCQIPIECGNTSIPFRHRLRQTSATMVGKTMFTEELCFADNNPLGEITCVDDGQGGAVWGPFRLNPACNFSSLPESEISSSLFDLLTDNDNDTNIKSVLEKTHNITTDRNLTVLDVFYTTNILEKTTQLQEISPQIASDIVEVYSTVLESDKSALTDADTVGNVINRILQTLDDVTAKLKPGPSGNSKIKTETFQSEVWDLNSENVTIFPVGLTLTKSQRGVDETSNTLFNETVDFSKIDAAIILQQAFLQRVVKESKAKNVRLSMNLYREPLLFSTKQDLLSPKGLLLNSKVISAKILVDDEPVTHLRGTQVTFIFKSNEASYSAQHICGYWNFITGSWSTDGCHHTGVEAGRDVCVCDHLTNFAVLLDFDGNSEESSHHLPLTVITMVGLILSIAGLSVTIASYLIFRRKLLKEHPQQTLFHLSLSQLCAWTVFLTGFNQTQSYVGCIMVAALLHYFIMASFLWMLAEAVLHYLLLVKVYTAGAITPHYMWKTGVPAWGLPILPVVIVLAVDVDLYRGRELHCWMSWTTSLYAFAIPIYIIVLCNLVFYFMIVHSMCNQRKVGQKNAEHKRNVLNVRISFFCFVLFGLSWVFGFLAVAEAKVIFQYIFCVTASTQGFLIFLFFTARNQEVRESWRNLCCRKTDRGILKMEMVPQRKGGGASGTSVETIETSVNVDTSA